MKQPVCLVTGANSGIGKEIALGLASSGAQVIMVCRDAEKGALALEEIKSLSGSTFIELLIADLSSQNDIRSLAKIIVARYPALDVLINNAGLVLTKKKVSVDGIEMTLATNHLGSFLLTDLLLDLLRNSRPARIINISSAVHKWAKIDFTDLQYERQPYQFMRAYAQSKLLMTSTTFALAKRLEGSGISINCVHPGAVRTNLGSNSSHNFVLKIMDKLLKFFLLSPRQAAKPIIDLALSAEFNQISGKYFVHGQPCSASALSQEPVFSQKVWQLTEKFLNKEHLS